MFSCDNVPNVGVMDYFELQLHFMIITKIYLLRFQNFKTSAIWRYSLLTTA